MNIMIVNGEADILLVRRKAAVRELHTSAYRYEIVLLFSVVGYLPINILQQNVFPASLLIVDIGSVRSKLRNRHWYPQYMC